MYADKYQPSLSNNQQLKQLHSFLIIIHGSILQMLMIVLGSRVLDMANVSTEWTHTPAPVTLVLPVTDAKLVIVWIFSN